MENALAQQLLKIVREAHFEEVVDFGLCEEACPGAPYCLSPAPTIEHTPNVDVAVIRLDKEGRAMEAANVLLSRDYPDGLIVPLDANFGATAVRFRRWDIERWNGGTFSSETGTQLTTKGWQNNPPLTPHDDIVLGRENAPYQFMSPYPASNFKVMVAYWLMRLVDEDLLELEQVYQYENETRTIHEWLDPMITFSDNFSTRALLKLLWDLEQIERMNTEFRNLGLATLQINSTDPQTGGGWQPGQIHMTALDTARLFWLINGTSGVMWHRPDGNAVLASHLSEKSRIYLKQVLAEQGLHECLSTGNLYAAPHTKVGIPACVPERWISPHDATVRVGEINYGQDVRPYNHQAEVLFMHKTGLTYNYASDAGIVQSLPGQPFRHYIIAFFANLGYRYTDPVFAARTRLPFYDPVCPISYTQRIAALGQQIDQYLTGLRTEC